MNNIDKLKALLTEMSLDGDIDRDALKKVIDAHVPLFPVRPGHVYWCANTRNGGLYAVVHGLTGHFVEGVRQDFVEGVRHDGVGFRHPLEFFRTSFKYIGPLSDYGKVLTTPAVPAAKPAPTCEKHTPTWGDLYRNDDGELGVIASTFHGLRLVNLSGHVEDHGSLFGERGESGFAYLGRADKLLHLTTDAVATDKD